jgi:hypothetical protein
MMNHQKILDKLVAKHLIDALDEDICYLIRDGFSLLSTGEVSYQALNDYVIPKLMNRWECALNASDDEVSSNYKQKLQLALAILLHKYGIKNESIVARAIESVRQLNAMVALSDAFARNENEIIEFLKKPALPLKKRPAIRESITFYRAGDIVAIQYKNQFYAAYIHRVGNFNSYPCLELYDVVFDHRPTVDEVIHCSAKGHKYNDGLTHIEHYHVYGLRNTPDLANQFHLLGSAIFTQPKIEKLEPPIAGGAHITLFNFLDNIDRLFNEK